MDGKTGIFVPCYKGYTVTFSIPFFIKYMKKKNFEQTSDVRSSHIYDI